MMANAAEVEVVVAHNERAPLRVGDVFVKIDADQARTDVEVEAMAPVPTPQIRWRKPPAHASTALPGTALGHLGEPSTVSPATARVSTATSSAPGGRCGALLTSAGWPSTATARPRSSPRSPCCDPGREAARAVPSGGEVQAGEFH